MSNLKNNIRKNFTICPNGLINDEKISRDARFLFVWMASKPSDWIFYMDATAKAIGCNVVTLRAYINELVDSGWMSKERSRKDAKLSNWVFTLHEKQVLKNLPVENLPIENLTVGNLSIGNSPLYNTIETNTIETNKDLQRKEGAIAREKKEEKNSELGEATSIHSEKMKVLAYLNKKTNAPIQPGGGRPGQYIEQLFNQGYTKEQMIKVIDRKAELFQAGEIPALYVAAHVIFKPENFTTEIFMLDNPEKKNGKIEKDATGKIVIDTDPEKWERMKEQVKSGNF